MSDYIARLDRFIGQLANLKTPTTDDMRKHYLLSGMKTTTAWTQTVMLMLQMDQQSKWSNEKMEQYLI